jgi:hypothetical protein
VYLLGVGITLVAVAFLLTDEALGLRHGMVTRQNLRRARPGMTMAQLKALLGPPFQYIRDEYHLRLFFFKHGDTWKEPMTRSAFARWAGADAELWVEFDLAGRASVVKTHLNPRETLSDRLRAWFGLSP